MSAPRAGDVLAAEKGIVTAPAGCGKTRLIADSISAHVGRAALVLTHTHAGVAALRHRLTGMGVPPGRYRLATLDGFALRLASFFPAGSAFETAPSGAQIRYPEVREAALRLLGHRKIDGIIRANYGRVFVDEYQDCNAHRHSLALALGNLLPICVFADDLQAIFDFNGPLPEWQNEVLTKFTALGELDQPWRWINAGQEEFGEWLLSARRAIFKGDRLDLPSGRPWLIWKQLIGDDVADGDARRRVAMAARDATLIIGDSHPQRHREFARQCPGVSVVEAVDLKELLAYASKIDGGGADGLLGVSLEFAAAVMTGVDREALLQRVDVLNRGKARKAATREEEAAIRVCKGEGPGAIEGLLRGLRSGPGRRIFRPTLFFAACEALRKAKLSGCSVVRAAEVARESIRHQGRALPLKAIGSTLLLKGLESAHAVILDADSQSAENLYVALTRASMSVTVFSKSPRLQATRGVQRR